MTRFAVEFEQLEEFVARLAAFERSAGQLQAEVDRRAKELDGRWRGAASVGHQQAQQRWTVGAREMAEALAELRSIAGTAHANYLSAARANMRMWSG